MNLKNQDTVLALKTGIVYLEARNRLINKYEEENCPDLDMFVENARQINEDVGIFKVTEVVSRIRQNLSYRDVGAEIGVSQTEVGRSIKRLKAARLISEASDSDIPYLINIKGLSEWTMASMQYANKPEPKGIGTGLPTAWSNPLLESEMMPRDIPHVWEGLNSLAVSTSKSIHPVQGEIISPLYKGEALAASKSVEMYKLLSLLDAFRIAKPRELKIARDLFNQYMEKMDVAQQFFS